MNWYDAFSPFVKTDVDLSRYSSFRIGGQARILAAPRNQQELIEFYRAAMQQDLPVLILGGGTNVLIAQDMNAIVIHTGSVNQLKYDEEYVTAECGVSNASLVATAAQRGFSGVECLAGVPGTVGGSIFMNAGGQHGDISERLREVRTLDREGNTQTLLHSDIDFGYRHSGLDGLLILQAIFKLVPASDRLEVKQKTHSIMRAKVESQPLNQKSAGCIFRNPDNGSAGRLIDEAGLKGHRIGGAVVSESHANFIINENNASYDDVLGLIRHVQKSVKENSGVDLKLEVRILTPDAPEPTL